MTVTPEATARSIDKARIALDAAKEIIGNRDITELNNDRVARYTDLMAIASVYANIARAEAAERTAAATERVVEGLDNIAELLLRRAL